MSLPTTSAPSNGEEGNGSNGAPPLRIIEFRAENIKALKAVSMRPDPNDPLVLITGRNEQGKSTILDIIWMTLGGKTCIPSKPIRTGEKTAYTYLDLGEFIVERRFTEKGEYLEVYTKEGMSPSSPQTFLSSTFNDIAKNPLDYMRKKPADQVETLQKMVRINLSLEKLEEITGLPATKKIKPEDVARDPIGIIDSAHKFIYDKRTEVNSEVTRLKGAYESVTVQIPAGKDGTEAVSVKELFEERKVLELKQQDNALARHNFSEITANVREKHSAILKKESEIEDLKRQLAKATGDLTDMQAEHQRCMNIFHEHHKGVDALEDPDFTDIDRRISEADETNRIAALVKTRDQHKADFAIKKLESEGHTEKLKAIREYKQELIEAAGLPVPGLGFADGEVTYKGLPLSQACGRDKLIVSCAICAAQNPKLAVLTIDTGYADLDSDGKQVLYDFAMEKGLQLWTIQVTDDPMSRGFHIYSGEIVAVDGEAVDSVPVETAAPEKSGRKRTKKEKGGELWA